MPRTVGRSSGTDSHSLNGVVGLRGTDTDLRRCGIGLRRRRLFATFLTATTAVCYNLFPFLLIYLLFCLSLCAAPCLALFAFLCACFIAYLCVVLGHILHDT